jgi:hypothetical protein
VPTVTPRPPTTPTPGASPTPGPSPTAEPAVNVVNITVPLLVGDMTISLRVVTGEGNIAVALVPGAPDVGLPAGFTQLGNTYQIDNLGVQFATARICIPYSDAELRLAGMDAQRLRLLHYTNDAWFDITDPNGVNTQNRTVCGTARSFSPFVIGVWDTGVVPAGGVPSDVATGAVPAAPQEGGFGAWWLWLVIGVGVALVAGSLVVLAIMTRRGARTA